jgi:hypothetical protein
MLFILLHLCVGDSWGQVLDILQKGAVFQWLRWWLGRIGQGSVSLLWKKLRAEMGQWMPPRRLGGGVCFPKSRLFSPRKQGAGDRG